ncbi:MAG: ribose 5-phosphate isomerase A [Bryobacteraceae bacterium]
MKITAALMPEAIEACLPFWVDRMGFAKTVEVPEGDRLGFVILARDGAELMLQTVESVRQDLAAFAPDGPPRGTGLFIEVGDFADVVERLAGYPIALAERTTFYGMREIGVFAPGGHVVVFAAPIAPAVTADRAKATGTAAKEKLEAAERAAGLVESGMVVGLGSGTTAALAVRALGRRVAAGLDIVGVPTSEKTAALARELGIRLSDLAQHERIDLTIDGADEVERGTLHLVKGLGGALLREKMVASVTARLVIVADESKVVDRLRIASGPIPIEVAQFGWQSTARRLRAMGGEFKLRLGDDGQPFVSDGGHYILDAGFTGFNSAEELAQALDRTVGVMEHGLFLGMAREAIIGGAAGVETLERQP